MNLKNVYAKNVKDISIELLKHSYYSIEQLATYLEVDRAIIFEWQQGNSVMNAEQLEKLCYLTGYSLSDLLKDNTIIKKEIKCQYTLENLDLIEIAKINKIIMNIEYMESMLKK